MWKRRSPNPKQAAAAPAPASASARAPADASPTSTGAAGRSIVGVQAQAQQPALPEGWQVHESSQYPGRFFYLHIATQTSQWERSVANALAARVLASLRHEVDIERAYTAGLLQNIGSLVLDRFLRDEQEAVRAELDQGAPLIEAERAVFGLSHAELGARLAARWNFPEILIDSIRHHHQPDQAKVEPRLVEVMHVAESLCWSIGCGEGIEDVSYGVQTSVVERLGMNAEGLAGLKLLLGNEIRRAQDLVGIAA